MILPKCHGMWACNNRLFQAAVGVAPSYDVLVNLFGRIQFCLQRLDIYTGTLLTTELTETLGKIMAEIILILALATKEVTRGSISEYIRMLHCSCGSLEHRKIYGETGGKNPN